MRKTVPIRWPPTLHLTLRGPVLPGRCLETTAEDFVISEGVLTFGATPNFEDAADANTDNVYLVTVEASDGSVKGTLDVTVTVTGVKEAPEFPATETGARAISENTEAGQPIGDPVEAEDPDVGDSLTYTLSGADAASFDIVTTSGQLQTKAVLDKETRSSYTVTVTASDGSLSDTQEVIITVTDANEPPSVSGQTSVSYEETVPIRWPPTLHLTLRGPVLPGPCLETTPRLRYQ